MEYTNSSLVTYTRISPNKTSPRTHEIDTITIHCVVGQVTVERLGDVFAPTSRKASSNYGVGKDGRIGMYVEEKDRSWCSSNSANDHRAITIEVASDTTHPYAVTDKALNALIELCADICKRNNIKKLVWSTNKNERVNHLNGCNMTVHRDFATKSCPGQYLYDKHGYIADEVNKRLGVKVESSTSTPSSSDNSSISSVPKVNITYAVKVEGGKVLTAVKNLDDYAGIENKKIIGLAMKVDKGTIKYQVHEVGGGWLPYVTGYNWNDHNNGYAGNSKPIDAVRVYYNTPSDLVANGGYREAKYRVSTVGSVTYYNWQLDDTVNKAKGMDGYAGAFGRAIDKFQICIE